MFSEEFMAMVKGAKGKVQLLKSNPAGYFIAAMLAGAYVGFGVLLIFSIGGMLDGNSATKIIMGVSFGIALSLVVIAGAELFTGNNLVMASATLAKEVPFQDTCKLWICCYIGNWVGSILLAVLFWGSGLGEGKTGAFIAASAAAKMAVPLVPLFFRAILCNILVCLAVWCGFRCKSESGKLIMIFWCLFAFITCGFEHSIANMTLLTSALLSPGEAMVSMSGYFYNIVVVTLGNMVGGIICVALPYYLISKKKEV